MTKGVNLFNSYLMREEGVGFRVCGLSQRGLCGEVCRGHLVSGASPADVRAGVDSCLCILSTFLMMNIYLVIGMCDYMTPFPEQMSAHISSHVAPQVVTIKEEEAEEDVKYRPPLVESPNSTGAADSITSGGTSNTSSCVVVRACTKTYGKRKPQTSTEAEADSSNIAKPTTESRLQKREKTDSDQLNLTIKEVRSVSENSESSSATDLSNTSDLELASVASEALLGILQPRRAKLAAATKANPSPSAISDKTLADAANSIESEVPLRMSRSRNKPDALNGSLPDLRVDDTNLSRQEVRKEPETIKPKNMCTKYKHSMFVLVKYLKDKGRVTATDKKCPIIEATDPVTVSARDSGVELDSELKAVELMGNPTSPLIHHIVSHVVESLGEGDNVEKVMHNTVENGQIEAHEINVTRNNLTDINKNMDICTTESVCGVGSSCGNVGEKRVDSEPRPPCEERHVSDEAQTSRSDPPYRKPKHAFLMRYHGEQQKLAESRPELFVPVAPPVVPVAVPVAVPVNEPIINRQSPVVTQPHTNNESLENEQEDNLFSPVKELVSKKFNAKVRFTKAKTVASTKKNRTLTPESRTSFDPQLLKDTKVRLKRVHPEAQGNKEPEQGVKKFAKLKTTFQDCFKKIRLSQSLSPSPVLHKVRRRTNIKSRALKLYRCDLCEFHSETKEQLFSHTNEKHSEEEKMYLCEHCDYMTSRQSKLVAHKKTHPDAEKKPAESESEKGNPSRNPRSRKGKKLVLPTTPSSDKTSDHPVDEDDNIAEVSYQSSPKASKQSVTSESGPLSPANHADLHGCRFCPYKTRKRYNVIVHERQHLGGIHIYKCQLCNYKASRLKQYMTHQEQQHKPLTGYLQCHSCEFEAETSIELKSHHLTVHASQTVLRCEECEFTTLRGNAMTWHKRIHHSGKQKTRLSLLSNKKSQMIGFGKPKANARLELRPFKCVICKFAASTPHALKRHMPIHAKKSGEVFECDHCHFSSRVRSMLVRHQRHQCKFRG